MANPYEIAAPSLDEREFIVQRSAEVPAAGPVRECLDLYWFELDLGGASRPAALVSTLNKEGSVAPDGKKWTQRKVLEVLDRFRCVERSLVPGTTEYVQANRAPLRIPPLRGDGDPRDAYTPLGRRPRTP